MKTLIPVACVLAVSLLVVACSGMQATSTIRQQIDEQQKRLPDFREAARQGIDRGQKLVSDGQTMVDDGRRRVRDGQALIAEGNESINHASQALITDSQPDAAVRRMLDEGTRKIRQGNAMIRAGNQTIADGQAMVRRGREQLESSLEDLRRVTN